MWCYGMHPYSEFSGGGQLLKAYWHIGATGRLPPQCRLSAPPCVPSLAGRLAGYELLSGDGGPVPSHTYIGLALSLILTVPASLRLRVTSSGADATGGSPVLPMLRITVPAPEPPKAISS